MLTATRILAHMERHPEVRARLVRWCVYYGRLHGLTSKSALARQIGVAVPTMVNLLNGKGGLGLDVFLAIREALHVPADVLLDSEPPVIKGH